VQWSLQPAFGRIVQITHALQHIIVALLENRLQETRLLQGIEQVLALFGDMLEQRQISVVKHYDDIPAISCYAGLEIVWGNLIENALEAIDENGTLDIHVIRQESHILVRITDSGKGVPEDLRTTLFERDVTTKPSGSDVHGAGLYIVRKIVLKHHGRIEFESQPGQTSFSVWLPLQHA
jgi:signal transduction histidine kinase